MRSSYDEIRGPWRETGPGTRRMLAGRRGMLAGGLTVVLAGAGTAVALASPAHLGLAGSAHRLPAPHGHRHEASVRHDGTMHDGSGPPARYSFRTLNNPADPTFNQLLGFNNRGVIAGYFGSGAAGHPNKGYLLIRTRAGFAIRSENFPGSVQTQVTGLNDRGVTVGFWSDTNNASETNDNIGFYKAGGAFHRVTFPAPSVSTPPVNQLLGVNNRNVAVGFYNDAQGNSHGYTFSIGSHRFRTVTLRQGTSVTAAAINNSGDIAGFFTTAAGATDGFLRTGEGRAYTLAYPGASATQALGVNDTREVVGVYTVGSGNNAVMHGFTWAPGRGFRKVDDPQGAGTTTINGVNDQGDLVGFYTDAAGNTDGFAAVPTGHRQLPGLLAAPAPSMSPPASTPPAPSMSPPASMTPSAPAPTAPATTPPATPPGGMPGQSPVPGPAPTHW